MAPTKASKPIIPHITSRRSVHTRSKSSILTNLDKDVRSKRKADCSPSKDAAVKRSAFGDITNALSGLNVAVEKTKNTVAKRVTIRTKVLPAVKTVVRPKECENVEPPPAPVAKITKRAAIRASGTTCQQTITQKPKEVVKKNDSKVKTRLSNEFEKSEESLYSSALENLNLSTQSDLSDKTIIHCEENKTNVAKSESEVRGNIDEKALTLRSALNLGNHEVPEEIDDFDKANWNDVFQVSHYAMDIFNYYKSREPLFAVSDYMDSQVSLTRWMRALLVDWMVEVQESFELNHETLYLGVKLVDLYLSKTPVKKDYLQLVGAAAMFIASKYDERIPPLIDDFLFICDGAYTRKGLLRMEINVLKNCDYDLGVPISYRFLRRYARCAKLSMPVLTLARYILEYSLMDYSSIMIRDSLLASAALFLALRMKKVGGWTPTLEFYTGYKLDQFLHVTFILNNWLSRKLSPQITTIKNKYSHEIFYEVAKTPLLTNDELRPN